MHKAFASFALLFLATALTAAPVIPGDLHVVEAKDGDQPDVKAQVNEVVEVRINDPVTAKRVSDVNVDVKGDANLAGVVNGHDPKPIGGGWISIIVGLKGAARSGEVKYSYKDGEGKEHEGRVVVQVIKEEKDK
jgi:hypothetical protein